MSRTVMSSVIILSVVGPFIEHLDGLQQGTPTERKAQYS
jgi:hypothetical protein